jgi:hypothetical protein
MTLPDGAMDFSATINRIVGDLYSPALAQRIYNESPIIGYLVRKTRAANRGSKSRGSFANLYAIYVLAEDYLEGDFHRKGGYKDYEGARFSAMMLRQRQLPFGEKLQNHALNSRLNDEFHKFYPDVEARPIQRDMATQRYWLNESIFTFESANLCRAVIDIIDSYVAARRGSFSNFIETCKHIEQLDPSQSHEKLDFVASLLKPNTDARIFEIVAYSIMKAHYGDKTIWLGFTEESIEEVPLQLHKTGRTNANDGGIDFVMRPLGRFFQVTETLDLKKYFLDIDKIQKFPLTFVIKTDISSDDIEDRLRRGAIEVFGVQRIVDSYMAAIEEIVNIPKLLSYLKEVSDKGSFGDVLREVIAQSRVEFNLDDDEEAMIRSIES